MFEELHRLGAQIGAGLKARGQTVAVIDGATGGLISTGLLTVPGATGFYVGGGVVYSYKGRTILLGLDKAGFAGFQPVSEPYALRQAQAVRDNFGADWGVAESGSAGPAAHPRGIPAGVSSIAVAGPGVELTAMVDTGNADRIANMHAFAAAALGLMIEALAKV